ncbi:MAG: hypothetical protein OXE43_11600 [Chloroflexi bacterium]|nr:hypothetical protein [Chloroflexota bacterium]
MVDRAAEAALEPNVDVGALRRELVSMGAGYRVGEIEIAVDESSIPSILGEAWTLLPDTLGDRIPTREERASLLKFFEQAELREALSADAITASREYLEAVLVLRLLEDAVMAAGTSEAARQGKMLTEVTSELSASTIPLDEQRQLGIDAFVMAVDRALEDELLTEEEREAFERYLDHFATLLNLREERGQLVVEVDGGPSTPDLMAALTRLAKAEVIRQVCEGTVPEFQFRAAEGSPLSVLPFNFQNSEKPVWIFGSADYYQMRTQRTLRGGSTGVSVRVAKGIYLRQSAFQGHPVDVTETVMADSGILAVTTKHIYFHGGHERFRVRYDKIVSFEPHDNGLGIMRDLARAKPESFVVGDGDGWFLYNLVTNVARS